MQHQILQQNKLLYCNRCKTIPLFYDRAGHNLGNHNGRRIKAGQFRVLMRTYGRHVPKTDGCFKVSLSMQEVRDLRTAFGHKAGQLYNTVFESDGEKALALKCSSMVDLLDGALGMFKPGTETYGLAMSDVQVHDAAEILDTFTFELRNKIHEGSVEDMTIVERGQLNARLVDLRDLFSAMADHADTVRGGP